MIPNTTIPITVTPEATEYIAQLGLQGAFEQMLEHTLRTVPGLRCIEITVQPPYDLGGDPCVLIEATREDPHLTDDLTDRTWWRWQGETFPPQVSQYFCFYSFYEPPDAR
jgi:hypothetical protein